MLVIHIGLPKTATTFLQYNIFKPVFRDLFFHKRFSTHVRNLMWLAQGWNSVGGDKKNDLVNWLRGLSSGPTAMITCENISSHPEGFWDGTGPSPEEVGDTLRQLRDSAGIPPADFKIILGVRRQDQMLGSRYSQLGERNRHCSQRDFERRVIFILDNSLNHAGYRWLHYDLVRSDLGHILGAGNVFMFLQEHLDAQPEAVLSEMGAFCGKDFGEALSAAVIGNKIGTVNKKSIGEDKWRLGDRGEEIFLPPELKRLILAHFAPSNDAFAKGGNSTAV